MSHRALDTKLPSLVMQERRFREELDRMNATLSKKPDAFE